MNKQNSNTISIFDIRDKNGSTPLHAAVQTGNIDSIKQLLENGANVELKNSVGQTALDIAKAQKQASIVELLEKKAKTSTWVPRV